MKLACNSHVFEAQCANFGWKVTILSVLLNQFWVRELLKLGVSPLFWLLSVRPLGISLFTSLVEFYVWLYEITGLASLTSSPKNVTEDVLAYADPPGPFAHSREFEVGDNLEIPGGLDMSIAVEVKPYGLDDSEDISQELCDELNLE